MSLRLIAVVCSLTLVVEVAQGEVQTKTISYQVGDLRCEGYLAWDDAVQQPRPGVLVLHEWWGLNDYARSRTRQLAELGYVAFAGDMWRRQPSMTSNIFSYLLHRPYVKAQCGRTARARP